MKGVLGVKWAFWEKSYDKITAINGSATDQCRLHASKCMLCSDLTDGGLAVRSSSLPTGLSRSVSCVHGSKWESYLGRD